MMKKQFTHTHIFKVILKRIHRVLTHIDDDELVRLNRYIMNRLYHSRLITYS